MKFGLDDKVIEDIQKVFQDNWKVDTVVLFGSRAKGNYREGSDIDLAVKGIDITFDDILSLSSKLDDLNLPYEIDLINYSAIIDEDVIEHIDRVGIVFYKRWKEYRLKDITTKIGSGATPAGGGNNYKAKGISLIRSQNILDLAFSYEGLAFIDNEQADGLKNVIVRENDVLLNITGDSVARVCKVPKEVLPARVNQHVLIIRSNNETLIPDYLLYYFQSIKDYLLSISEIGGTRNALTKTMIENLLVFIPPPLEQKSITYILRSLDNKIDLLQRQNKTLEQLAETLFGQWFEEEAKEDWEVKSLTEIADYLNGLALQKFPSKGTDSLPVIKIRELKEGISENTDKCSKTIPSEYIINDGDVLFSWSGSLEVEIWHDGEGALNQHLFKVSSDKYPKWFYYLATKSHLPTFKQIAESKTTTIGHIQREHLKQATIAIPDKELFKQYDKSIAPLIEKKIKNNSKIRSLTQLRDALLPKLMSGEMRVKL